MSLKRIIHQSDDDDVVHGWCACWLLTRGLERALGRRRSRWLDGEESYYPGGFLDVDKAEWQAV